MISNSLVLEAQWMIRRKRAWNGMLNLSTSEEVAMLGAWFVRVVTTAHHDTQNHGIGSSCLQCRWKSEVVDSPLPVLGAIVQVVVARRGDHDSQPHNQACST